jgi:hypothetical protein
LAFLREIRLRALQILATLGLTLKDGGQWDRCERGIPFLGFVVHLRMPMTIVALRLEESV